MTDQPRNFDSQDALNKAKDYARDNPEHARSAIDKVEDIIDQRTGGKYSSHVDKAGDWVEGKLGLPNNTNNPEPAEPADKPAEPADQPAEPADKPAQPTEPADKPAETGGGDLEMNPGQ